MIENNLVSVIIAAYNYADFINQAIDSVLRQTYKNIELIIINDGSTDNTDEIINGYSGMNNVVIVSRDNKGVIYTRNEGVGLAKGEFIMQLDADDYIDNKYIEKCVNKAINESLDIVYTQVRVFNRLDYVSNYPEFDLEKLKHDNYIHATSLVRKSAIGSDPYDSYLDSLGNEDWDLFLDLCLKGAKAGLINEPLLYYRKHTNRKSRADNFEGLYKEALVRHHIWSKQNAKYPDQFWYFSSEINSLLETINLYQKCESINIQNKKLKDRVVKLEKRDIVTLIKKVLKHIR